MEKLILILSIGQAICLANAFIIPILMANDDAIEIELNDSFDSLKAKWHKISGFTRAAIFSGLGIVSVLPAAIIAGKWLESLLVLSAYGLLSIALHWIIFDRKLNKLRGLDPDYVGQNANSDSFLKRFTAKEITRLKLQFLIIAAGTYLFALYLIFI